MSQAINLYLLIDNPFLIINNSFTYNLINALNLSVADAHLLSACAMAGIVMAQGAQQEAEQSPACVCR